MANALRLLYIALIEHTNSKSVRLPCSGRYMHVWYALSESLLACCLSCAASNLAQSTIRALLASTTITGSHVREIALVKRGSLSRIAEYAIFSVSRRRMHVLVPPLLILMEAVLVFVVVLFEALATAVGLVAARFFLLLSRDCFFLLLSRDCFFFLSFFLSF